MSLYVSDSDMSLGNVLNSVAAAEADYVKSQTVFSQFYSSYGWYGTLTDFDTNQAFKVQLASAATMTFTGMPNTFPKDQNINTGWNWMACPYSSDTDLSSNMPTGITYVENDLMKSQTDFTTFYAGFGWYGTLTLFEPGKGYKIQVATGGTGTFQEPSSSGRRALAAKQANKRVLSSIARHAAVPAAPAPSAVVSSPLAVAAMVFAVAAVVAAATKIRGRAAASLP